MNKNTYIVLLVIIVLGVIFFAYRSSLKEEVSPTNPVTNGATVSTLSIINVTSPALAVLAGAKIISWQTANYPTDVGVNINLIRKTSDSPRQFTLVRTLTTDTPDDGEELWTPQKGENTSDLYVEVTCSSSYEFKAGCSLASEPIKVN